LLLDEAGLSLHPLAQKDLSAFFNNLSQTNQIINTTHSPFIVDTNHIDRAKVVYVDKEGYTVVSNNLRAAEERLQTNSVYAVHAALGLSISDILLQGCRPVIVEGPSDQFYLNAIKLFLIRKGLIAPKEERNPDFYDQGQREYS
jgi:predicted ATP-dependent endonuclease of OLD family